MTAPVWTLSVDLQTKTAVFQSGLADAAKSARGSFNDIKSSAADMSAGTRYSMRESRESVMALGEIFGVHLPASITRTLAGLESLGPALAAALPFAAIAVGAALFIEHLRKAREEAEKIADKTAKFGIDAADAMSHWNDKILQTDEKLAELNGDYLQATLDKLQLIDHQTLHELNGQFDKLASDALASFKDMEVGLMSFLFLGKQDWGAKEAEQRVRALSKAMQDAKTPAEAQQAAMTALMAAQTRRNDLEKTYHTTMIAGTSDAIGTYDQLISKLQSIADLTKGANKSNKGERNEANVEEAQRETKAWEESVDRRAKAEQEFYARTHKAQEEAGKKSVEAAYEIAMDGAKATAEVNKQGLEQFNAIQAATLANYMLTMDGLKNALEEKHRLGLVSETEYAAQMKTIYREQFEAQKAFAELQIDRTADPDKKLQLQQRLNEETRKYADELNKVDTGMRQFASSWSDYFGKMDTAQKQFARNMRVELQGSIGTITQGFATGFGKMIVEGKSLGASMQHVAAEVAEHWIESLMKQVIAHEMTVVQHIVGNQIMAASDKTTGAMSQLAAAKAGAAKAYQAMAGIPIVGPALGAVAAVGAFSLMMAFEKGGIVPGVGVGDTVPAMLTPGESVLPKALTEHLTNAAKFGKTESGNHMHIHHSPTYHVHAIDGASVEGMLKQHSDTFTKHFHSQVRRMKR